MSEKSLIIMFQQIEDDYNTALETNEVKKIRKHLTKDWTLLEPKYGLISRKNFLGLIESGALEYQSMQKQVLKVKQYGDTAIVITKGRNIRRLRKKVLDSEKWISNTWIQVKGQWKMVMSQESAVID
ncbi:MAG: nuclear transport factor 2 family protein [Bacteroidota bacterium]